MSDSEDSTVTYTTVSSPYEGRSGDVSPEVDGPPVMPKDPYAYVVAAFQALPPPDYVPDPEEPEQAPPSPDPEEDDDEDLEEDLTDYPVDHDDEDEEEEPFGDDADKEDKEQDEDDDDEEEEHPASADSIPPPPALRGRQTEIFQRVKALVDDSQYHYETGRLVDQEARCSRKAWAHSIGLSSVVHFKLQGYMTHTWVQDQRINSQDTLIATLTTQLSSLQGHLATALGEIQALQAREQAHAGGLNALPENALTRTL
nr:hypothetical protein [Tanacetum cinerariifolium]